MPHGVVCTAAAVDAGDTALALADFEAVLQSDPRSLDALYYRGCVLEKQGLIEQAIAEYSRVLQLDPDYVKAWYSRASCRNAVGDLVQAIGGSFGASATCIMLKNPITAAAYRCTQAPNCCALRGMQGSCHA